MKNKIVLLLSVLAVMVLSVVSVYGITGQSISVESAYAANTNITITVGGYGNQWSSFYYTRQYYVNSTGTTSYYGTVYNGSASVSSYLDLTVPVSFELNLRNGYRISSVTSSVSDISINVDSRCSFTVDLLNFTGTSLTLTPVLELNSVTIPTGYVLAETGVDYGFVDYFIDTSATVTSSYIFSESFSEYPYFDFGISGGGSDSPYWRFVTASSSYNIFNDVWSGSVTGCFFTGNVGVDVPIQGSAYLYITDGTSNTWLYVSTAPSSVTQSTTVEFDTTQIDSLTFDGISFSTTGQSQEIMYDNDNGVYSLSVVPVNGYKAVSASVTYLSDVEGDLPAVYDFVNNQVNINCPVGDAVTSITIESEGVSVYVNTLYQEWLPNIDGDYTGTISYEGEYSYSPLAGFILGVAGEYQQFDNYEQLLQAALDATFVSDALLAQYRFVGAEYSDGTPITYPITIDTYNPNKSIMFLTIRNTAYAYFSASTTFVYYPNNEFENGMFPAQPDYLYAYDYMYTVAPYLLSSNWTIVSDRLRTLDFTASEDFPYGQYRVQVYIDGALHNMFMCERVMALWLNGAPYNLYGCNLSEVQVYLSNLTSQNDELYYLNTCIYNDSLNAIQMYFSSGKSEWQPSLSSTFGLLGEIMDNTFEILNIQIAANITIGQILLVVLGFGVLLFIFRISGVF